MPSLPLLDGNLMDPMWNDFNKLSLCCPRASDFQAIFALHEASLFIIFPPLVLT